MALMHHLVTCIKLQQTTILFIYFFSDLHLLYQLIATLANAVKKSGGILNVRKIYKEPS